MNGSEIIRRRRWQDRVATWGTGALVATVAGACGLHPVRSALLGVLGAVVAAAGLTHAGAGVRWYREHTAAVGLWAISLTYAGAMVLVAWLRWGA